MKYYAMQVKSKTEDKFINRFRAQYPSMHCSLYFPKRIIFERKKGAGAIRKLAAVFPGYLFAGFTETDNPPSCFAALRNMAGFCRFLPSNTSFVPLSGKDLEIVLHFIKNEGAIAGVSTVFFNADDRIVVVEGALKGLEGKIVKVDKRKRRAKIKLDLYNETFSVDMAFEILDRR